MNLRKIIREEIEKYLKNEVARKVSNAIIGTVLPESDIYQYVEWIHKNQEDFREGDLAQRIEYHSFYKLTEIPLNKINLEEWMVDEDKVEEYVEFYQKNKKYPPIVIDDEFSIIDGTHRANALNQLGFETIKAWIPKT